MMSGKKLVLYSDGASRGNPGPAGIGIVICDERGEVVKEDEEFIGTATNNVAEYRALIKALELASNFPISELECFSDSELMIKQLNGDYAVKNPRLQELFLQVREKEKHFGRVSYVHVSRAEAGITRADQLANRAIEKKTKRQIAYL
jgi:ribonuclease HI